MNAAGMVEVREGAEHGGSSPRLGMGQVAVTAVFTFTCFTVPVLTVSAAERRNDDPARAEVAANVVPVWSDAAVALQVKDMKAQFRAEQELLLARYQEQLKLAQDASREERDRIRAAFKDEQAELAVRQRELREELKAQMAQYRREHPDHLQAIEAAREATKARGSPRRGTSAG